MQKTISESFNTSYVSVQGYDLIPYTHIIAVSIHPMCRFKNTDQLKNTPRSSFNTSYVSVQVQTKTVMRFGISRFNTSYVSVQEVVEQDPITGEQFQYILCVGSSRPCNTPQQFSFVSIHPMCRFKLSKTKLQTLHTSFNTSYVSVQVSYSTH